MYLSRIRVGIPFILSFLFCFLFLNSSKINCEELKNMDILSKYLSGIYMKVETDGDIAYVNGYSMFMIFDVSDRNEIELINYIDIPDIVGDFEVNNDLAYISSEAGLVLCYDISDLNNPTELWRQYFPNRVLGLAVKPNILFVGVKDIGLYTIDISDSFSPELISVTYIPSSVKNITTYKNNLFYCGRDAGLKILDISDTENISVVGEYEKTGFLDWSWDAEADDNYLYCSFYAAGLVVLDISEPETPVETVSIPTPSYSFDLFHSTPLVYIADGTTGLYIYDISDPYAPVLESTTPTGTWLYDVWVEENTAYLANGACGLQCYDVASSTAPEFMSGFKRPARIKEIIANDTSNQIITGEYGYGVSLVSYQESLGEFNTTDEFTDISDVLGIGFHDGYIFVGSEWYGLRILEYGSGGLNEIGFLDFPDPVYDIVVSSSYAYLAMGSGGLAVVNIADIHNPNLETQLDTPGSAERLILEDDTIYLSDNSGGLRIIDVSNPAAPEEKAFIVTTNTVENFYIYDDKGYMADGNGGVKIFEIISLCQLNQIGSIFTHGFCKDVLADENYIYAGVNSEGLKIYSNSESDSFAMLAYFDTPGWANSIDFFNDSILIGDYASGLWLVRPDTESDIKGEIKTAGNKPVPNITVKLTGDSINLYSTTDGSGRFSFEGQQNWKDYQITPQSTDFTFSPESYSVNDLDSDQFIPFTAYPSNFNSFKVYPNPVKVNDLKTGIHFENIPINSEIKIFSIAGDLIFETGSEKSHLIWELNNNHNKRISSGIYIYVISFGNIEKTGKIAIIK